MIAPLIEVVSSRILPAGSAASLPVAEARGITPRFGELVM